VRRTGGAEEMSIRRLSARTADPYSGPGPC
jgi:hypothetical protein